MKTAERADEMRLLAIKVPLLLCFTFHSLPQLLMELPVGMQCLSFFKSRPALKMKKKVLFLIWILLKLRGQ